MSCRSAGAVKGDLRIPTPRPGLRFAAESPPSSYILEKGGDSRPCSAPANAGGALANSDLTVSHCNFPLLGPAIFGSGNYEVSCESPVSRFVPGGNRADCVNVLGRRGSCSPAFYRLWPFFSLPGAMCSPFFTRNCHAGSEQWLDGFGFVLPPAMCHLSGQELMFQRPGGDSQGVRKALIDLCIQFT